MMIKRMKNRYETVLICVALALGCDASQHNEEMSRDRSEGLLLKMWEILTQYSKFVLNTVDMITGLIYSHLLLLYFKKSLVLIHRLFILCLLSYLSTFSLILLCLWQWRHIVCSWVLQVVFLVHLFLLLIIWIDFSDTQIFSFMFFTILLVILQ